jgi:hypothetical protein
MKSRVKGKPARFQAPIHGRPTSSGESVESIFVKGRERNYGKAGIPVDESMIA